jgi:hypothetical protein
MMGFLAVGFGAGALMVAKDDYRAFFELAMLFVGLIVLAITMSVASHRTMLERGRKLEQEFKNQMDQVTRSLPSVVSQFEISFKTRSMSSCSRVPLVTVQRP